MTKKKKTTQILLAVRLLIVLAAVIYAIYWFSRDQSPTNPQPRWKIFLQVDPWLFMLGVLAFFLAQVTVGIRWWLLLRTQSVFIPLWAAVKLNLLGLFYSNFMPSAVGGDLLRAWYVTKHTNKKFVAVLSVFVDRIVGLTSIAIMAIGSWVLFMRKETLGLQLPDIPGFIAKNKFVFLTAALAVVLLIALLLAVSRTRQIVLEMTAKIKGHINHAMKLGKDAFFMYCKKPLAIFWTFLLTVSLQTVVIISLWLIADNMGMDVHIKYFFVFFPISWVMGAVPVTPGGAVLVEGILVTLFTNFTQATLPEAFVISMCQRFIWLISSTPGALIHLSGTHLPKDFNVDEELGIN